MAKARWADGLRTGSTKTKTYQTLPTRKEGRVQIIKDRVYDITNPQTTGQMIHRAAFVTATIAAERMLPLIGISFEGVTKKAYARRYFVGLNARLLGQLGRSMNAGGMTSAAYSPKGNKQLIPNSYIVSEGSVRLPYILTPQVETTNAQSITDGESFSGRAWRVINGGEAITILTVGSTYTAAQLWKLIYGLEPGDQLTVPQIFISDDYAQSNSYITDENEVVVLDLVRYADFAAPRLVLKDSSSSSITISASTTIEQITAVMRDLILVEKSNTAIIDNLTRNCLSLEVQNDALVIVPFSEGTTYEIMYSISDDDRLAAVGAIVSRKDENGKWHYSTSQLFCVYEALNTQTPSNTPQYFGYTLANAIETYLAQSSSSEGNFMQTGTQDTIVPPSFQ